MAPQELLAAYPRVRFAVAWTEMFACVAPDDGHEPAWDLMMRADPPLSPDEMVDCIRDTIREVVEDADELPTVRRASTLALPQVDHPDYLTYIRGKMGCM